MLLSEAKTKVAAFLDDASNARWSTSEISDALGVAQKEVWNEVANAGLSDFTKETTVTSSSAGVVDLTSLSVKRILAVSQGTDSNLRIKLKAVRPTDVLFKFQSAVTLNIHYLPRVSFPAGDGYAFTWTDSNTETTLLDEATCLIAASHLLATKEGELTQSMQTRKLELLNQIRNLQNSNEMYLIPMRSYPSQQTGQVKYYTSAPQTLQLCY